MTTDFQTNLLKYLLQTPDGSQYFPYLDSSVFDLSIHKIAYDVLNGYYKQYGQLPTAATAEKVLRDELKSTKEVPEQLGLEMQAMFTSFKEPLSSSDLSYIGDTLIKAVQDAKTDQYIMKYGEGKMSLDQLTNNLGQLSMMKKKSVRSDNNLLIQDRKYHNDDRIKGHPTFLHDLNSLTSARGFYSPQLVIFMSGPKHFKTGVIIKLAVEYARDGYNVYYADGENGLRAIRNRSKMAIMEATLQETLEADDLDITMDNFHKFMGGDIFIDYWPARTATVGDVKSRINQIRETKGFNTDIIIWDSIDHFLPTNPRDQNKDTRFQIQYVYHEVIALNEEINTFSIAPSQVNKAAISKKVFDMRDLSEDFGKAMNAHAIFAICATDDELEQNLRRIVPVVQREGARYNGHNHCVVHVDEERMIVSEVDKDEYYKDVSDD